jgi:hypothetical protein
MAHHDLLHASAPFGPEEPRAPIDDLIRPGLRRAFPLPETDHAEDERFRVLLEALAVRSRERSQVAAPENASTR